MMDFFEILYWNRAVESLRDLPKEVLLGAAAGFVVISVHKTHCQTRVNVAEAEARKAEADLQALKIKTFTVTSDPS